LIDPFVLEQRPDDTGILVGKSHRGDVRVAPADQSPKPALCIADFTLGRALLLAERLIRTAEALGWA
jgi:hypothetical protein